MSLGEDGGRAFSEVPMDFRQSGLAHALLPAVEPTPDLFENCVCGTD
jgi:hypothetical protein